jgi:hypothetical protein
VRRWRVAVVADQGRQVLVQRPAEGDVENLQASADAEQRQPGTDCLPGEL